MNIGFTESNTVEFKREYVAGLDKTIIAFVNARGGTLYTGVANKRLAAAQIFVTS